MPVYFYVCSQFKLIPRNERILIGDTFIFFTKSLIVRLNQVCSVSSLFKFFVHLAFSTKIAAYIPCQRHALPRFVHIPDGEQHDLIFPAVFNAWRQL